MRWVVDASVALKWFATKNEDEEHIEEALELLRAIQEGKIDVIQPAHWKAEVLGVLARRRPEEVGVIVGVLDAMQLPVLDSLSVYQRAALLSVKHKHHLFGTLYHAVALETGGEFITADKKYVSKAAGEGALMLLGAE
jgi:predicted nucleic acid-binding protein